MENSHDSQILFYSLFKREHSVFQIGTKNLELGWKAVSLKSKYPVSKS